MPKLAQCPGADSGSGCCCTRCGGSSRRSQGGSGSCTERGGLDGCGGSGHGLSCPLNPRNTGGSGWL